MDESTDLLAMMVEIRELLADGASPVALEKAKTERRIFEAFAKVGDRPTLQFVGLPMGDTGIKLSGINAALRSNNRIECRRDIESVVGSLSQWQEGNWFRIDKDGFLVYSVPLNSGAPDSPIQLANLCLPIVDFCSLCRLLAYGSNSDCQLRFEGRLVGAEGISIATSEDYRGRPASPATSGSVRLPSLVVTLDGDGIGQLRRHLAGNLPRTFDLDGFPPDLFPNYPSL